jgi:proteic killer suppression protein
LEIVFKSKKLKKNCEEIKNTQMKWGEKNALKIVKRLNEIDSFENLAELQKFPPARLHRLTGKREGQYAIDIKQPFRLIIEPMNISKEKNEENKLENITKVKIIEVTNYHD